MVSKILPDAIKSYQNASKMTTPDASLEPRNAATGPGFAEFLKDGVETAIHAQRTGEAMTARYLDGKADLHDVVNAMSNAETMLNTVVAVRDRVIQSYQEIMRMPI